MLKTLFQRCDAFYKRAKSPKISVVENTDPVLRELSDIKEFDDRVAFAKEHWELLGEGSARAVFKISDELIIKVAINPKGIEQDLTEADPEQFGEFTNPVVVFDPKGKWIIARFTENVNKDVFKKHVGVGFDVFMSALDFALNNNSDRWKTPKDYDEIKHLPLFEYLVKLVVDCNLLLGDIGKPSSFGLLDGEKIVLRDGGFSKSVAHAQYRTENATSTSSKSST